MPGLAVPGQELGGPPAAMAPGAAQVTPGDSAHAMAATAADPCGGREYLDDGPCWEDDDWDPAGSLTAREIAALAALDRAADRASDWDDGLGDTAAMAVGPWPGGPRLERGERYSPCDAGPVEVLPGLTPRRLGAGGGFEAGGVADRVPPGPVLAGLAESKWAAGLSRASDDELAGLMIAWRRVASWATAGELAAVAELCRRRDAQVVAGADPHLAEHVSDEVAMALTLTSWAAGRLADRAQGLARLPKTMAALAAGEIDVPKALVILGELSGIDGVHACRVEAAVIGRAAGWTTGELRQAVRRQVIAADPAAAHRRKEQAEKQARVERWAEEAGTAALAGRDLPPAGVLAADAHLTAWAKRLKTAGLGGNLDQLRAQAFLALLNGQSPGALLCAEVTEAPAEAEQAGAGSAGNLPTPARPGARADGSEAAAVPAPAAGDPAVTAPGRRAAAGPDRAPGPAREPLRGSVNLVLPLSTWLGRSPSPGEVAGFGPLDAADSRALAAALARDPATKWCLTVTGADGQAVAHGCAKTGPGQPPTAPPGRRVGPALHPGPRPGGNPGPRKSPDTGGNPSSRAGPGPGESPGARAGPGPGGSPGAPAGPGPGEEPGPRAGPDPPFPPGLRAWLAGVSLAWLETGQCSHGRESPGYRPSPNLAHLIQIRQVTCTAPGCRHPAASCDFEHTIPYHHGGRSCECNGGPCCRRHHRAKQAGGWQLSQPSPGIFVWSTPHGRSYQTEPDPYPV